MAKAVHFGAGNIGCGFIADLLHESGHHVTLLDVNSEAVANINKAGAITLRLIDHDYALKSIGNVNAIAILEDPDLALAALTEADLITTSVWANNLSKIAPLIAEAMLLRQRSGRPRINVIACENAMFASSILREEILAAGKGLTAEELDELAAFPNSAVDRVVLPSKTNGVNSVDVADYFELAIERNSLVSPDELPIKDAVYAETLEAYLVRKLYVVNCGHLWAGLLANLKGISNVREIFTSEELVRGVREAMKESAAFVQKRYGFDKDVMLKYVEQTLTRYKAKGVNYDTEMVVRSPIRKLSSSDRFVGPAKGCESNGLPNARLLEGIAMLLLAKNDFDSEAVELQERIAKNGAEEALEYYSEIRRGTPMHNSVMNHYHRIRSAYQLGNEVGHG